VALLKGLPAAVVDEVLAKRITLTPGGVALVRTMRAHGAYTCLVSGGFTVFTSRVADMIGFQENRANTWWSTRQIRRPCCRADRRARSETRDAA